MKLRRALGWSFSQQAGLYALQLLSLVVIARLLRPEEVGVFVIGISAGAFIAALREAGLTSYLIREPCLTDDKIRTVFGVLLMLTSVVALLMLALRAPLAALMEEPGVADVLVFMAAATLLSAIELPSMALLRREMRFDLIHHVALASRSAGVVLAIALAWAGFSYMALAWGYLATTALRTALLAACEPRPLRLGPALCELRSVVSFGGWMTGSAIAGTGVLELPKLLIGALLGSGHVAFYDYGMRIPMLIRKGLVVPFGRVLIPSFAEDLRAGRSIGRKVERFVAAISGAAWPVLLICALLSERIVLLLFGVTWASVAALLPWLLSSVAVSVMLPQAGAILVPHGCARRLFLISLAQLGVMILLAAISTPFGLEAYVAARTAGSGIMTLLVWLAIRPYVEVSAGRLLRCHAISATGTLAAAAPLGLLLWLQPAPSLPAILSALALAPALWLGALHLFGHVLADELLRLGRHLMVAPRG